MGETGPQLPKDRAYKQTQLKVSQVTLGCTPGTLQCSQVFGWLTTFKPNPKPFLLAFCRAHGTLHCAEVLGCCVEGYQACNEEFVTLGCAPGTLQCAGVPGCCAEGSQAYNEGSRYPWLHPWHPSMRRCFWLLRRRVPGMQRRVFVTLKP